MPGRQIDATPHRSILRPNRPPSAGGRQWQRKNRLGCQARSCRGYRRTYGRRRPRDKVGYRIRRDEPSAADDDAGKLSSPEKVVDRVSGNATEEFSGFLDGVKRTVLHGALNAVKGSRPVCYWAIRPVVIAATVVLTTLRVLQDKRKR
jgi:hypothetical protein